MSLIDPTRHKRKSTFFTVTPTTSSESTASSPTDVATSPSSSNAPTLNFNVKNPRKALLEKLLEPGDRLVQTVQVNKDLNSFFEKKFLLKIKFQSLKQSTIPHSFWTVFFSLRVNGFVNYASFATDPNSVCWEPISTTTKKMNPQQSGLSSR